MFKVGDRVEMVGEYSDNRTPLQGDTGTVKGVTAMLGGIPVEFDKPFEGAHDCYGLCKDSYGYAVLPEYLKLIDEEEPTCATTA